MKLNWKIWLQAVRPFAFSASIVPVVLGAAFAYLDGYFDAALFFLTILGGIFIHSGANLINDYMDYMEGVDTPDSLGSSGLLPAKILSPWSVLMYALVFYLLSFAIGIYLICLRGIYMMSIIILGLLGSYGYTGKPIYFKYRALGIPLVFLMMGPLMVMGSYYVHASSHSWNVVWASLPVGLLVAAILHSNDIRDIEHDSRVGIKTFSMLLGSSAAKKCYFFKIHVSFIFIVLLVTGGILPWWSLITLIAWPKAFGLTKYMKKAFPKELILIDFMTAKLHLQVGFLLIFSLVLSS